MKVYIITKEPFPNGMAATNRIKCYARALHEGGMDCEVLIYGGTEIRDVIVRNTEKKGEYGNAKFRYIGGSPILPQNKLLRMVLQSRRLFQTVLYLRRVLQKGDILFLFMGEKVNTMLRFMKIAKRRGAYCVRDLCELPYGTGAETKFAIRMRKVTLEKQFPKLDGIISISEALLNLARTYTQPSCKHIKVPIMVEYEHYAIEDLSSNVKMPYIFHAGTLSQQKDGILGMIEAFGRARQRLQKPIKYILTSTPEASLHVKEIRQLIEKYHLEDSIEFVGYLVRDQIKEYLSKASLVISNRPKSQQDYYGFSTKVGEYLASGTPLITTNWGEAVNWLKDGENAYFIEPEDINALTDAIVWVFENPEVAKRVGEGGKLVCKKYFDYKNWITSLSEFMYQLGEVTTNSGM